MKLIIRIPKQSQAAADELQRFVTEQLGTIPQLGLESVPSRWRTPVTEVIVLTCTILQGAGAALYLANELEAKRRISSLLRRLRRIDVPGTITVEPEGSKPLALTRSTPDEVLKTFNYAPPKTDSSDKRND